jgi:Protein of unknown function (DUF3631)
MTSVFDSFDVSIDGVQVLNELHAAMKHYVIFPSPEAIDAVVLWTAATYAQPAWQHATRLHLNSPVKRCGKSRLLDLIEATCYKPIITVNISAAAMVRILADDPDDPPALLIDEIDTVFGKKASENHEDLRGILNAGHQRNRPYIRCAGVGANQVAQEFPSFAMAALAGIGSLPGTLEDRSIGIRMRRRAPGETVAPFRIRKDVPLLRQAAGPLGVWVRSNLRHLADAEPMLPVQDRAADCWEPLVAIADLAGGGWAERSRAAAFVLTTEAERADAGASMAVRLLADLRSVFTMTAQNGEPLLDAWGRPQFCPALFTDSILGALYTIAESPWASYYGRQFSARDLAGLLGQFGVESREVRIGNDHRKGYRAEDLWDAWTRYT